MRLDSSATLSGVLLGAGVAAYVMLAVAYAWRMARYRQEFLADSRVPRQAFAFFIFVAGSDVLADPPEDGAPARGTPSPRSGGALPAATGRAPGGPLAPPGPVRC